MASRRDPRPLTYAAHLDANEDGSYVATFPDFGVGVAQGDDREEALARAADLLETIVANYMAECWQLPDPSPAGGGRCAAGAAPRRQGQGVSGVPPSGDRQG
jgi:predicted RNase H-like HicB family nuclease